MKTIGEFYRENVLSLPKRALEERYLPNASEPMKIEKTLFGWKLHAGRKTIECRSEEEARYLRVFIDIGAPDIMVPKDDEHLASILPELERLKRRTDEIINDGVDGILNRRIRQQVRHQVYMGLMEWDAIEAQ